MTPKAYQTTAADIDAARRILGIGPKDAHPGGLADAVAVFRGEARVAREARRPLPHIVGQIIAAGTTADGLARWDVPSSSPGIYWNVEQRFDTVNGGHYLFCNCPSWKFKRGKGQDCKHVQAVQGVM